MTFASMGPVMPSAFANPCGKGFKTVERNGSLECAPLGLSSAAGTGIAGSSPSVNKKIGETKTVVTDQLGAVSVEKKSFKPCRPYYLMLDSGLCIKDTGVFRETKDPKVPYESINKCGFGEKLKPSRTPRKGAMLCVKLR